MESMHLYEVNHLDIPLIILRTRTNFVHSIAVMSLLVLERLITNYHTCILKSSMYKYYVHVSTYLYAEVSLPRFFNQLHHVHWGVVLSPNCNGLPPHRSHALHA